MSVYHTLRGGHRDGEPVSEHVAVPRDAVAVITAMSHAPFGCVLVDSHTGQFLQINNAFLAMLGYTRDELLGTTWQQITLPDDAPDNIRAVETLRDGTATHLRQVQRYVRSDGSVLWADLYIVPLQDGPERRRFNIAYVTDISQEASITQFMRLLSALPDGNAVAQAMALGVLRSYAPLAVGVYAIDTRAGLLRLTADVGLTKEQHTAVAALPLHSIDPLTEAALHMRELRIPITDAMVHARSLISWASPDSTQPTRTLLTVPISSRGIPFGLLLVVVPQRCADDWNLHVVLSSLASAVVLWLHVWMSSHQISPPTVWVEKAIELSPRQIRILLLVACDMTNRQIARELGFAESTIKTDLVATSRLLGAHGRRDVVLRAQARGLIP